ncbi:polyprenol monophosphomannose synthase [Candidatus Cardinium hertigii]|jgi:dolichol-phosphate mannosyltransferase|uniref:Polyprenol monophosphomannose synthase n=1 Tax=Candidatus Cardinium hertigii TaxID=247481 RepID=A0A3N2QCV6_9BACT|nr:polyprenol monophosphomannose synthase [Candidatus Cardinium hertigii]ROT47663.1 polyprenol monophosphomannose synthase [Candidatus Cardinium hertigii]
MSNALHAIVVIPTYNERDNIKSLLSAIFDLKMGWHVLVVDDTSPDGTADVVKSLQLRYVNQLHLLSRPEKEGLGRAYLAGFTWTLAYDYDYICSMDADFSHAPADLFRLLTMCAKHNLDIIIGSRYIADGHVVNWPYDRILLSRLANWIARCITNLPVKDATAGFICYRRALLEDILLQRIASVGYSFQIEMKFWAHHQGAKLVELPITFTNRVRGISKMDLKIAGESFFRLFQMRWRSWIKKR